VFEPLAKTQLTYESNGSASIGFNWSDVENEDGTLAARITGMMHDGQTYWTPYKFDILN
jgi:iron complex outermembrane receptor protein